MKQKQISDRGDAFWAWSVKTYAEPKVRAQCLRLQNEFGFDVNIMLWLCWLAAKHQSPSVRALETLEAFQTDREAQLLKGLRRARRALNVNGFDTAAHSAKALKEAILHAELGLEKTRQYALAELSTEVCRDARAREVSLYNFAYMCAASIQPIVEDAGKQHADMKICRAFEALVVDIFQDGLGVLGGVCDG